MKDQNYNISFTVDQSADEVFEAIKRLKGTSAGVVGTIVCPNRRAIVNPAPSLPLFGSD